MRDMRIEDVGLEERQGTSAGPAGEHHPHPVQQPKARPPSKDRRQRESKEETSS